jgi:hypothetical protein
LGHAVGAEQKPAEVGGMTENKLPSISEQAAAVRRAAINHKGHVTKQIV